MYLFIVMCSLKIALPFHDKRYNISVFNVILSLRKANNLIRVGYFCLWELDLNLQKFKPKIG